jgi:hypothetical protein
MNLRRSLATNGKKGTMQTGTVEKFGKPSDHKSATLTGSVAKICDSEETKYSKSATLPVSISKICDSSPQHRPSVVQKICEVQSGPKNYKSATSVAKKLKHRNSMHGNSPQSEMRARTIGANRKHRVFPSFASDRHQPS